MSQNSLTRGIIGKEFLISEDILISNYNPFQTTNTSGPGGLKEDTILTGKLYLFNKKEFQEPTKEEFQNIKAISELSVAPYKLIPEAVFNSLSVSILTKWNETLDKRTFELISGDSILDTNPVLSNGLGIEEFIKDDTRNLLGTFAIIVVDHNVSTGKANKKNYMDFPTGEQFFMYMIPSKYIEVGENFNPETNEFLGISFSFQDASKQNIILNNIDFTEQTLNDKQVLTGVLNIPGDTNYTRNQNFHSLECSFVYSDPVTDPITELVLNDTIKQNIITNLKESLINNSSIIGQELFNLTLTSSNLRFTLIDNKINVNVVLTNTEEVIILPETPSINFGFNKEVLSSNLILENITIKGIYLLPLKFSKLEYNVSNGTSGFFELQQLASNQSDNIVFSTGDPDLDLPNRKVYMYGGRQDKSNTLWRSNIQNDGSLEGFTQIGINTLNMSGAPTYTYINNPEIGTGWVYVFCGYPNSSVTYSNQIKRAPILEDGTIGSWEAILTIPGGYLAFGKVIHNPEDKRTVYFYGNIYVYNNNSNSNLLKYFYVFKIQDDGSLTLEQTYTSSKSHYSNASIILRDPIQNKQFLYIFGTMDTLNDPSIYKYELDENGLIIGTPVKVGNIDKPIHLNTILEDKDNIYMIGGYANSTSYKIGARRIILKYPKDSLIKASPTNLLNPEFLQNLNYPLNTINKAIKTKYGYYLCGIKTTNNETGSTLYWESTNKILGFKLNEVSLLDASSKLHLEEFNFPVTVKDDVTKVNLIPNKLGKRIREELLTNLFVKQPQTLTYNSKPITFILNKDEEISASNPEITVEENTYFILFPKEIVVFLNWLKELMSNTLLNDYNYYLTYVGLKNTNEIHNLFIPELIFNILGTQKLSELNIKIFTNYFNTNPPSNEVDPNKELSDNKIKELLSYFYKNKLYSRDNIILNNKTNLIFNSNGLNFPDFSRVKFNINTINYQYIFIPQRTKIFETSKNLLKNKDILNTNISLNAQYCNSLTSGIRLTKKVADIEEFYGIEFDYYISPNGDDNNTGKSPGFPKATLTNLPVGSTVLLLPGEYKAYTYPKEVLVSRSGHGPETWLTYRKIHPTVFYNMPNDLKIYGCGVDTVLNYTANLSQGSFYDHTGLGTIYKWYYLFYPFSSTTRAKFYNINFKTNITISHTYDPYHFKFGQTTGIEYYNCNFINQNIYSEEGPSFKNCILKGGTRLGALNPSTDFTHLDKDRLFIENPMNYIRYNKNLNNYLLNSFEIEPMYTLIPIGNEGEENVIQLETTVNITTIPNLNYKLS